MIVYLFWASVWAVAAVVFALLIGAGIHLADARAPRPETPEYEAAA